MHQLVIDFFIFSTSSCCFSAHVFLDHARNIFHSFNSAFHFRFYIIYLFIMFRCTCIGIYWVFFLVFAEWIAFGSPLNIHRELHQISNYLSHSLTLHSLTLTLCLYFIYFGIISFSLFAIYFFFFNKKQIFIGKFIAIFFIVIFIYILCVCEFCTTFFFGCVI